MMLTGVTLRRLWRERRRMGVLLLAICLVTAFLSLAPLYTRAINASELASRQAQFTEAPITLMNSNQINDEMAAVVAAELGGAVGEAHIYSTVIPETQHGPDNLLYTQVSAYRAFDDLFTLVEGRLPQATAENIEVVLTQSALEGANGILANEGDFRLMIGSTLPITSLDERTITLEVVGVVTPTVELTAPRWGRIEQNVVPGVIRPEFRNGLVNTFGFTALTTEAIYDAVIQPVVSSSYNWRYVYDASTINVDNIDAVEASLERVTARLRDFHPESEVRSPLSAFIDDFQQDTANVAQPVLLVSVLVLALMLYNLVTIISLILEQQREEWAAIASRGGSNPQLLTIHALSMAVLCGLAALVGPFLAVAILSLLSVVGPQAAILESAHVLSLPLETFVLSIVAGGLALLMLTLPGWAVMRQSLLALKRNVSRPPSSPVWARFFVDGLLLLVGGLFLVRLYTLASGNPPADLLRDPGSFVNAIGAEGVESLEDPFNLIGPALLLTGAALLWIRVFPLLMRLFGVVLQRFNDLTTRMALWNVERDPGHYAQLVLLVIGTLALGTASLSLIETRNSSALAIAQQETGGDVRVSLQTQAMDPHTNWLGLPGAVDALPLMALEFPVAISGERLMLYGADLDALARLHPSTAEIVAQLQAAQAPASPGYPLPEDAGRLTVEVYTEPVEEAAQMQTQLYAQFLDANKVRQEIALTAVDQTQTGAFVTYGGELPAADGWRFVGLRFEVERLDAQGEAIFEDFLATVYLDELRVIETDGTATTVSDFETVEGWAWMERYSVRGTVLSRNDEQSVAGEASLRVTHRVVPQRSVAPVLDFRVETGQFLPAVVSEEFAETFGLRTMMGRPLQVGDEITSTIDLSMVDSFDIRYRVVGITESFPTQPDDAPYLITRQDWLQTQLNTRQNPTDFYGINAVWLNLENDEPTAAQQAAIEALPGYQDAAYAWTRFQAIQRDPLANGITGMLFAGFWVSLGLILLDFAFYMAVTTQRRAVSMAVLRSIGWDRQNIWRMLSVEQAAFITPALFVGLVLGAGIAYLILPFLGLVTSDALLIPLGQVVALLLVLVAAFTLLLAVTAVALQRMDVNQAMRQME